MDVTDRIARLEDALIDLAIVVSEGHLSHLVSANISSDVVEAGQRLQLFHQAVTSERGS
ncbi:MAG TPA: hypothetical protein VMV14_06725 [Acidimicrobiales bacterium]|nr:hypothetical protein [Acidimicrobiales bacterium]